jgi:signal transduction histidine kinase
MYLVRCIYGKIESDNWFDYGNSERETSQIVINRPGLGRTCKTHRKKTDLNYFITLFPYFVETLYFFQTVKTGKLTHLIFFSKYRLLLFFLLCFLPASASETILLTDLTEFVKVRGNLFDVYEDKTGSMSLAQIISLNRFSENSTDVPNTIHPGSNYWMRLSIAADETGNQFVFELFDFRIDEYEIFFPVGENKFIVKRGGDLKEFRNKTFHHKNFVHYLPKPARFPQYYYVRIRSKQPVGLIGEIRTVQKMISYSNTEYFLLALFYGGVLAMAFYNIFLFFSIKDKTYLYYVMYVLSIAAYALTQDGLGYQYLWPDFPDLNIYVPSVALYSMVCWALLYGRSFLSTREDLPFFEKGIIGFLIFRTIIFILSFTLVPLSPFLIWIDLIPLCFLFIAGVFKWRKGFVAARFFVSAFSFLFVGFCISILTFFKIVKPNALSVYSFNMGVVAEMMLLSLALADRIKVLMKENQMAHILLIQQLTEKEELKDRINRELEEKVTERTRELEEKNRHLDSFVYKASHDIKGPLKSIMGLTYVGLKDVKDPTGQVYLNHILKSTKRLDSILNDLLSLSRVQNSKIELRHVNFEDMVGDVLASFNHHPDYENICFGIDIRQEGSFLTDEKLLYSILQNLMENGIKYRDPDKRHAFLNIKVYTVAEGVNIEFEDNGVGIPEEYHHKIFDMFFKVDERSIGTGLGLYIVKIAVEKLLGNIEISSVPGEGTSLRIFIPHPPSYNAHLPAVREPVLAGR